MEQIFAIIFLSTIFSISGLEPNPPPQRSNRKAIPVNSTISQPSIRIPTFSHTLPSFPAYYNIEIFKQRAQQLVYTNYYQALRHNPELRLKFEAKKIEISHAIDHACSVLDTCAKQYTTTSDYMENIVNFLKITIPEPALNKVLLQTKDNIIPWIIHKNGTLDKPTDTDAYTRIQTHVQKFRDQVTEWQDQHSISLLKEVLRPSSSSSFKSLSDKFNRRIAQNKINQDFFKMRDLCHQQNFEEASELYHRYKQAVYGTEKPVASGNRLANAADILQAMYINSFDIYEQSKISSVNPILSYNQAPTQKEVTCLPGLATDQLTNIASDLEYLDNNFLDLRYDLIKTINRYSSEAFESLPKLQQEYTLSTESKHLLKELNLDEKSFDICYGNEIQQKVHLELVTLIDSAVDLYKKAPLLDDVKDIASHVIEFADVGNAYNQAGNIKTALTVTDCSWVLLNCGNAIARGCFDIALGVGEGVLQATGNVAHSIVHPIETTKQISKAASTAGYYLGKMMFEVMSADSNLAFIDPEYYEQRCLEQAEKFAAVIDFCNQTAEVIKNSSLRDVSREITAFAVEGYLTGKALSTAGKFLSKAKNKAIMLAQKAPQIAPKLVAATTEGIPVHMQIGQKASDTLFNLMEKAGEKIQNASTTAKRTVKSKLVNQTSEAILKNGYYEVNGLKFSEYYYNHLWKSGRTAPSLAAKAVLENAKIILPDSKKQGFFKYISDGWEMVYNPITKEVWHLQPVNK